MSGALLYCIVPVGHHPGPDLTGVDGQPVRGRSVGPLVIWLSSAPKPPVPDLDRVRQHHGVVWAATSLVTPVPVRFGDWLPDEDELEARTAPRIGALEAALAAVSGRLEYGVSLRLGDGGSRETAGPAYRTSGAADHRSGDPRDDDGARPDGRAFLRALAVEHGARRGQLERREALLSGLRTRLSTVAVDERTAPTRDPGGVSVAHLVARDDQRCYLRLVHAWIDEEAAGCQARVTGPWPPYSFAPS